MSLRARFMTASGLLVLASLAATAWTLFVLSRLSTVTGAMVRDSADTTAATTTLTTALEREDDALLVLLGAPASSDRAPLVRARVRTNSARSRLRALLATSEDRRRGAVIDHDVAAYRRVVDGFVSQPGTSPLERYHREVNPLLRRAVNAVAHVRDDHFAEAAAVASVARAEVARTRGVVAAIAVVALLLALVLATRLARFVTSPLRQLAEAVSAVREGRFDARVETQHGDELGQVAEAFNEMATRLAEFRRLDLDAVLKAKATLEATLDALPDAVVLIEPDGTVAARNAAAEALYRRAGLEAPRAAEDLQPLGLTPEVLARPLERIDAPESVDLRSSRVISVSGEPRRLLPRVAPTLRERERPSGVVVVLSDVTELARLDEMRAELIAVASHELQTPVTTLRMSLMLLQEASERFDPRARDLVANALGGVDQLRETVDALLDMTRIEAGRLRLNPEPISLDAFVHERVAACRARAEELGVSVDVRVAPGLPPVYADRSRARIVVDNLLTNALKYTPSGGRVEIRLSQSPRDRRSSHGAAVRLVVSDTGPGVPPEFQGRVFEKFFRVEHHRPTRDVGPRGSGIGLYLCKEIVELHGGSIACEGSGDERGATFVIDLPAEGP